MYVRRRMKQCLYLHQQILQCFASLQMQLQSPHLFTACALIMTIVALVRVRVRVRCRTRCAHRRTGFLPGAAQKAKKC